MDDFKAIYKILKALHAAMDYDEFDLNTISYTRLNISENRWLHILRMLSDSGYIEGLTVTISLDGMMNLNIANPRLTLRGLEYLEDNTFMKRAQRAARGIKEMIPGA